jgi:pimeloyl-ACP methyl ester carboxylesterase
VAAQLSPEVTSWFYDRRGYGEASGAPGVPATVDRHVDDLVTLLDGRRAVVIGHSFGGVMALGAAVRAPALVAAVGLYETPIAWAPGWDDRPVTRAFASPDPAEAGMRLVFGNRLDLISPERRAQLQIDAVEFVVEEKSVRGEKPPYDLADVSAPVIYARSGPEVLPAVVAHLEEVLPQFGVIELPGAGHHGHRSDPAGFADFVRRTCELAEFEKS